MANTDLNLGHDATAANNLKLRADGAGGGSICNGAGTALVTIPATGGISLGNEALSVYDEGTWTPANGTLGGTGLSFAGTYVRIGKLVAAQFVVTGTGITAAAAAYITGLPFAASGSSGTGSVAVTGLSQSPVCEASASNVYFSAITSTTSIYGQVVYFVA